MQISRLIGAMTLILTTDLAATETVEPSCIALTDVNLLIDAIQTRTSWIEDIPRFFPSFTIPPDTRIVGSVISQTYSTVVLVSEVETTVAHNAFLDSFVTQGWQTHRSYSEYSIGQPIVTTIMCHEKQNSIEIATKSWGVNSSRTTLVDHPINECEIN